MGSKQILEWNSQVLPENVKRKMILNPEIESSILINDLIVNSYSIGREINEYNFETRIYIKKILAKKDE